MKHVKTQFAVALILASASVHATDFVSTGNNVVVCAHAQMLESIDYLSVNVGAEKLRDVITTVFSNKECSYAPSGIYFVDLGKGATKFTHVVKMGNGVGPFEVIYFPPKQGF